SLRRLHWSLPAQRIRVGKINLSPLCSNPTLLRQAIKIAEVILDVGIEAHPFREISSSFCTN
ncbi:UNVERIFIED_CONTAM: hypothetical protein QO022_37770, partial [Pseudomonas aeruginosa]